MSKALLEDAARQLLRLAERLAATVPPGHVDYISKADASHWAAQLHVNIVEALRAYGAIITRRRKRAGNQITPEQARERQALSVEARLRKKERT